MPEPTIQTVTRSHTFSHLLTPSHTFSHLLTPSHTFSHLLTPSHGHDSYLIYLIANYLIAIWQLFDSYQAAVIAVMCRKGVVSEVAPRTLLLEEALVLVQVLASRLRH